MSRSPWPFVVCLAALALCAAALVLLVPQLIDSGGEDGVVEASVLAVLVVVLGLGARRWRPDA